MRRLITSLFILSCHLAGWAKGADGVVYESVRIGEDVYNITCEWLKTSAFDVIEKGLRSDFFVCDGVMYFNYMIDDESCVLDRVDATDGSYLGPIEIDWGDIPRYLAGATFVGRDSHGTPFVASTGISDIDATYPYTITTLDIVDGIPRAGKQYRLVNTSPWITGETSVCGSLLEGKFSVIAEISIPDVKAGRIRWGYARWDVNNTPGRALSYAAMALSKSTAVAVEGAYAVVYDSDDALDGTAVDCALPTLCRLGRGAFDIVDTFDGPMHDSNGTGLDIVSIDDLQIMVYGSGYSPARYCIVALNDFPQSLDCNLMWELGGLVPYTGKTENKSDLFAHNFRAMAVHAYAESDGSVAIYMMTGQQGVAKYLIQKEKPSGVSEIEDSWESLEYYNMEGLKLAGHPTEQGYYICRPKVGKARLVWQSQVR